MAVRAAVASRVPLIVILGATGTGKTKLSVELAKEFSSEIINSDSMQVYKGLDISTAKATPDERAMVPHHLVDILEPHQKYSVVDFRNKALNVIDNLMSRNICPIIVGGTNYYMESILWKILVNDVDDADNEDMLVSERDKLEKATRLKRLAEADDTINKKLKLDSEALGDELTTEALPSTTGAAIELIDEEDFSDDSTLPNEFLYNKLKEVDPAMAERLHPNNRRKILRALQVWQRTGKRHSDFLLEQKDIENTLRYPDNTIVLWLICDQKVHDERLNNRVDGMINEGLLDELTEFHEKYNKHRVKEGIPADYTDGVFQSIGLKEFHPYLMLKEDERNSEAGQKLFREGVDYLKTATRRYARKQMKLVRHRILNHPTRQIPLVFDLDTTDLNNWETNVKVRACKIVECFLKKEQYPFEPLKSNISDIHKMNKIITHWCHTCKRIFIGDWQYGDHMKSKKHKKEIRKRANESQEKEQTAAESETAGSSSI